LVDKKSELVRLSDELEWFRLEEKFGKHYEPGQGRPGVPVRALTGLLILKYLYGVSDKEALERLCDSASWQYFCGYRYYLREEPFTRALLSVFRRKIGEEGAREIFQASAQLGVKTGVVKPREFKQLHVDTTVQEKHVAYPHSAKLLKGLIKKLNRAAKKKGIRVKQSYKRVSKALCIQALRYSNARQFKRMRRCIKKLVTIAGRLSRDIERKSGGDDFFAPLLELSRKVCFQSLHKVPSSEYIYSLHEQHIRCIAKGKAHKKYEFGNKVSLAITDRSNFIVGCDFFAGNPHDAHTLATVKERVEAAVSTTIQLLGVDLGYRGSGVKGAVHARLKKLSAATRRFVRRHPKIEAVISHTKRKFLLARSRLKGIVGDQMNCLFAAAAYNLSLIMRKAFT
jgi:IS5 family transposase